MRIGPDALQPWSGDTSSKGLFLEAVVAPRDF